VIAVVVSTHSSAAPFVVALMVLAMLLATMDRQHRRRVLAGTSIALCAAWVAFYVMVPSCGDPSDWGWGWWVVNGCWLP
jgi:Ca2+/Na+ antiporter